MRNHTPQLFIAVLLTLGTVLFSGCGKEAEHADQCDMYNAIRNYKNKVGDQLWPLYEKTRENPTVQVTEKDGSTHVTLGAGKWKLVDFVDPFLYFDFQTKKALAITDKEAITTNASWDIGFRDIWVYSNGGPFPGKIEIARLTKESAKKYESIKKEDIGGLSFVHDDPVSSGCKVEIDGTEVQTIRTAFSQLHKSDKGYGAFAWFDLAPPNPLPGLKKDNTFYIIKNTAENWVIVFEVLNFKVDAAKNFSIEFRYRSL